MFQKDILQSFSGLKYIRRGTDFVSLVSTNKYGGQETTLLRTTMLFYRHMRGNEIGNCLHILTLKKGAANPSETSVSVSWTIWCHNPEVQNQFNPEGDSISLRNVGIRTLDYMASKPRSTKSLPL